MGSEHYCLRWNNHQSNLLGVFSQLLRDESLVDVTLACSEGHSIRAHKVVLSACSSYFQTLFVDHPSRHPIVILKDVRFAELRTLVEFMYKGEVNVEYCQLSALLKTAESLKVKGLAEMTNLSGGASTSSGGGGCGAASAKQEALGVEEPDQEPEQTEPTELVSKPSSSSPAPAVAGTTTASTSASTSVAAATTGAATSPSTSTGAPPAEELTTRDRDRDRDREARCERDRDRERERDRDRDRDRDRERDRDRDSHREAHLDKDRERDRAERRAERERERERNRERERERDIREHVPTPPKLCLTPPDRGGGAGCSPPPERARSSAGTPLAPEDHRASDMTLHNNGTAIACSTTLGASGCNRLASPILSEPLPGPSNMPPVQEVPLSLKKEVDWGIGGGGGGLADDKSTGESSSDYPRHAHDPDLDGREAAGSPRVYSCMYCGTTFQHQSKLTRHILSHSLESLKYREPQHQLAHCALVAAESPLIDFSGVTRPGLGLPHEPPDALVLGDGAHPTPMDLELSADGPGVVLCKFCGKSFPDVSSLIAHLPVHTGDRPFKCEFCGKAFKLRHHMKDHCRVHTGERPFRCTLCGKTFSRSTILKAHEKTHYPKYVRKFLSPSPLDTEEESPH